MTFELLSQPTLRLPFTGRSMRLLEWNADPVDLEQDAAHYFYIDQGQTLVSCSSGEFLVGPRMYGCLAGGATIESLDPMARGMVVSVDRFAGMFHLGGPLEETGRLQYIDGCSDSLLIPPGMRGDPCFNYLHLPAGIDQTRHTHPSFRLGLVVRGAGICRTDEGDQRLAVGDLFLIHADGLHSFHTHEQELAVVAFHPDSDFGPTHDDHPMLNRTWVDGVSAQRRRAAGNLEPPA
ncbi:AraC-like ligand binding domain protein [Lignipirellula cremea]|uniref:AraC-like ligand binding domain protein n=2 Tax=Lignipirellula cremea TaxID=2528010 RepID=A0A518DVH8_9BACT|nr:AraC-like ligand binding domain protein [Lignipirellula cremea]